MKGPSQGNSGAGKLQLGLRRFGLGGVSDIGTHYAFLRSDGDENTISREHLQSSMRFLCRIECKYDTHPSMHNATP